MLTRKVPLYLLLILILLTAAIATLVSLQINTNNKDQVAETTTSVNNSSQCNYKLVRLGGYTYIRPLIYAEPECESSSLNAIKSIVAGVISSNKLTGNITSASVYLRNFSDGNWASIGDEKKYYPGSLLKVPTMIAFMKMKEKIPGFLDKKITYDQTYSSNRSTAFLSKSIRLGNTYTIRELLKYMISYSDNNATTLLNQNIDVATLENVFTDLGIEKPDAKAHQYPISAKDYSQFFKVLYNASYLSKDDSEFCIKLLTTSDFSEGMLAGFPPNCTVAHKFGEGGFKDTPGLSESGIVFVDNKAFILTIMTEGKDMNFLSKVISEISRTVYNNMIPVLQKSGT